MKQINIQQEVSKILDQHGNTEMGHYKIQLLFEQYASQSFPSEEEIATKAKEEIPEDLYKDCSGIMTIEDRNLSKRNILIRGIKIGIDWLKFYRREEQTTRLIKGDSELDMDIVECCKIGPITDENYCPRCGKKIIK